MCNTVCILILYIRRCVYVCTCVYLYVYMCVYVYVCVGVYVQIHMYIFEEWFFFSLFSFLFCVPYSCLPTVSLEVDVQTLKPPSARPLNWEVCKSGVQFKKKKKKKKKKKSHPEQQCDVCACNSVHPSVNVCQSKLQGPLSRITT